MEKDTTIAEATKLRLFHFNIVPYEEILINNYLFIFQFDLPELAIYHFPFYFHFDV